MAKLSHMSGVNEVLAKLNLTSDTIGLSAERGLKKGGLFLQRESQKICPVDTDNLRAGAFTRNVGGSGFKADIIVGYVASYAVYVHENLESKHKPGKKSKYLESPAREKKSEIFQIIRDEANI